nr:angiomotin-like [Penaeus vannamei]
MLPQPPTQPQRCADIRLPDSRQLPTQPLPLHRHGRRAAHRPPLPTTAAATHPAHMRSETDIAAADTQTADNSRCHSWRTAAHRRPAAALPQPTQQPPKPPRQTSLPNTTADNAETQPLQPLPQPTQPIAADTAPAAAAPLRCHSRCSSLPTQPTAATQPHSRDSRCHKHIRHSRTSLLTQTTADIATAAVTATADIAADTATQPLPTTAAMPQLPTQPLRRATADIAAAQLPDTAACCWRRNNTEASLQQLQEYHNQEEIMETEENTATQERVNENTNTTRYNNTSDDTGICKDVNRYSNIE